MDNLDDSENNAKKSDSAYSNSCSNSQSRRSHSSKSTHSGSNSSGSSGYGGKPSTSSYSNSAQPAEKRSKDKDIKKKKQAQEPTTVEKLQDAECRIEIPPTDEPLQDITDVAPTMASPMQSPAVKGVETMEISNSEENRANDEVIVASNKTQVSVTVNYVASRPRDYCIGEFSCVISMQDGVVMYTTPSLTSVLGFPKDMWIGRPFIDFVHSRDRNTFASQITSGLAIPKNLVGTQVGSPTTISTMVCRIRKYRGLQTGFAVKDRIISCIPFMLKFFFKNINDEDGKSTYLVIQATEFISAFRMPNEVVTSPNPFIIRHAANGNLEYIDPEAVSYLGYLPQDVIDTSALQLYHPEDLTYLRHVYEVIVKEGGVPRSKPYRMLAQNGDFVQVETEWTSFINPWSKKLEYVIGKHYILQGPINPDVFQSPDPEKALKQTDEQKNEAQSLKDMIIRILNEVLTKPAEAAKMQINKRCQDLATYMESLMEESKPEEELRIDTDNSFFERDSVMLGGISPHHDHTDCKSSTETRVSYNQLNYNETMQRYFDSHQPYFTEEINTFTAFKLPEDKEARSSKCLTLIEHHSSESGVISSTDESGGLQCYKSSQASFKDYQHVRLTEDLLYKHNSDMERELMKIHRSNRSLKGERDKVSIETRLKKKEHLARCKASFQFSPSPAHTELQPHGMKRPSINMDTEVRKLKQHCSSPRWECSKEVSESTNVNISTITSTQTTNQWAANPTNSMNTYILGVPPQMPILSPAQASGMPGIVPMYYTPTPAPPVVVTSAPGMSSVDDKNPMYPSTSGPYLMYGAAVYGHPYMYPPACPQTSYPIQQNFVSQSFQCTGNPLGLTNSNYEEACKPSIQLLTGKSYAALWKENRSDFEMQAKPEPQSSANNSTSTSNRESAEVQPNKNPNPSFPSENPPSSNTYTPKTGEARSKSTKNTTSEDTVDKTDGESSYSSFYSSFFKTESGSAEESGDGKKGNKKMRSTNSSNNYYEEPSRNKLVKRSLEPSWMEQVCVTSELIYKYQVITKSVDQVLSLDKEKIKNLDQPDLVNEQLGQLYLDLQLEGVASRLTLEEGITSSSSSSEESTSKKHVVRKKREYSKLVMIYEEDAPLPSPSEEAPNASQS